MAAACPPVVVRRSQRAGENLPHGFNWTRQFSRVWRANEPHDEDVCVRPTGKQTGLQYRSSGGQSSDEEPAWPVEAGGTVQDGPITWTAEELTVESLLYRIQSNTWDKPAEVTLTEATPDNLAGLQRTGCLLKADAAGEYTIVNTVLTVSPALEFIGKIILTVVE